MSVPHAKPAVSTSRRAELRAKCAELRAKLTRDKLQATIRQAETSAGADGALALQLFKQGRRAEARVLLRKRRGALARLQRADVALATVTDFIDRIDNALDNARFVEALEQGTALSRRLPTMRRQAARARPCATLPTQCSIPRRSATV